MGAGEEHAHAQQSRSGEEGAQEPPDRLGLLPRLRTQGGGDAGRDPAHADPREPREPREPHQQTPQSPQPHQQQHWAPTGGEPQKYHPEHASVNMADFDQLEESKTLGSDDEAEQQNLAVKLEQEEGERAVVAATTEEEDALLDTVATDTPMTTTTTTTTTTTSSTTTAGANAVRSPSHAISSSRALRRHIDSLPANVILGHIRASKVHSSSVSLASDAHVLRESLVFALAESAKLIPPQELENALLDITGNDPAGIALVAYLMNPDDENAHSDHRARSTSSTYLRSKYYQARKNLQVPALESTMRAHLQKSPPKLDCPVVDNFAAEGDDDDNDDEKKKKKTLQTSLLERNQSPRKNLPEDVAAPRVQDTGRAQSSPEFTSAPLEGVAEDSEPFAPAPMPSSADTSARSLTSPRRRSFWSRVCATFGIGDLADLDSCGSSTTSSSSADSGKSRATANSGGSFNASSRSARSDHLLVHRSSSGGAGSGRRAHSHHCRRRSRSHEPPRPRRRRGSTSSGGSSGSHRHTHHDCRRTCSGHHQHQHRRRHHHHGHHKRHHHYGNHHGRSGHGCPRRHSRSAPRLIDTSATYMRTTPHGADSLWKKLGAWRQIFAKKADKPELKSILKHTSCGPSRSQRGLHAHKKKSLECIEAKHVHFGVCSVISDSGELLGCVEVGTEAPCLSADPVARATLLCFQRPTEDPEKSRESNDVDQQEDDSQLSETSSSAHVSVSATRMASQSAPCAVTNLVSTPPAPVPHSGVMVI